MTFSSTLLRWAAHCFYKAVAAIMLLALIVLNTLPTEEYEYDELRGWKLTTIQLDAVGSSRTPGFSVKSDDGRATVAKPKQPLGGAWIPAPVNLARIFTFPASQRFRFGAVPARHAFDWRPYSSRAPPPATHKA
jgi:hypothetical protein